MPSSSFSHLSLSLAPIFNQGSHQILVNMHLAVMHYQFGVTVKMLDPMLFPSGMYYKRPDFMADLRAGKIQPHIFHHCWTSGRANKV